MSAGPASAMVPAVDRVSLLPALAVRRHGARTSYSYAGLLPWQKQRVLAYIEARLDQSLRAPDLAAIARLSPSHFSRSFKISFGISPSKYVLRRRVDRAKRLILADHTVPLAEIALLCGLADQSHLSRVFRQIVAETPGGWRRKHQSDAIDSTSRNTSTNSEGSHTTMIKMSDGTAIFFKDWGSGQPIVFHHGWPLSADDWDSQMLFFLHHGYRVIAHDRRGHGRSTQTASGNDMDTYADDVAQLVAALDLRDAIHIGHSTGGGEVARYVARHGKGRVAKAVLVGAVTPIMLKTTRNPDGVPLDVFDGLRAALLANRSQFYRDLPAGPFYGFNRPSAKVADGVIDNWWRQGMMGGAKAHYDCIKAFSETDFTEDLRAIAVPTRVLHGDDDQIVPYKTTGVLAAEILPQGSLTIYPGLPHGMLTTHADMLNADILKFIRA